MEKKFKSFIEPLNYIWLLMSFGLVYLFKPSFRRELKKIKTGRSIFVYLRVITKREMGGLPYFTLFIVFILPLILYVIPLIITNYIAPYFLSVLANKEINIDMVGFEFTGFLIASISCFIISLFIPLLFPVPSTMLDPQS